jgi:RHS repeat-associated protein
MVRAGVTYVYVKNHLGSVRAVVNASTGQVVQALDYDVWGNVLADSSPGFQPFAFAGGLYDSESKLTHFGWRDYDASTGTWTSREPLRHDPVWVRREVVLGVSMPSYSYSRSNPVARIDPTGLEPGGSNETKACQDACAFAFGGCITANGAVFRKSPKAAGGGLVVCYAAYAICNSTCQPRKPEPLQCPGGARGGPAGPGPSGVWIGC